MSVPYDVLSAAKTAAYATEAEGNDAAAITSARGVDVIAKAILAERQRCVDIAERVSEQSYEESVYPVERIRAAILAGGTA